MRLLGRQALLVLVLFLTAVASVSATAAEQALVLSAAERTAIARAFAPVFVFHALEEYFPTSPVFPLDSSRLSELSEEHLADVRTRLASAERTARYRALSVEAKLEQSAVQYRVFSRLVDGRIEVVAEYWCYYVFNAFTVRVAWFPHRVPDNHPHDLERVYFVLRPVRARPTAVYADEAWARSAFRVERVVTNAHDGSIPPNQYVAHAGETLVPPLAVLVERGSHAMAPDINRDGRFTPADDSTGTTKLLWGIRDRGTTWGRYRASYMDLRGASSVRLCGPATRLPEREVCRPYALTPAGELQDWFRQVPLSPTDRRNILGDTPWLTRAFGDVRVEQLMFPTDPPDGRMLDSMLRRRSRTHAGYVLGWTTTGSHVPTFLVGRRYFWEVPSRYAPDIIGEAMALFPVGGRRIGEATVFGSYSLDAVTSVLVGTSWMSNGTPAPDVVAGVDLRIGLLRVRPTWGFRGGGFDSRLTVRF
jgi:hypothetical protein